MNEATRESERVGIMSHPWNAMRQPGYAMSSLIAWGLAVAERD
jgi:hypothetical protein